ncbi:MAG: hypothetical protein NTX56_07845 [Proteobacteria bacterium]|nr:hypothetical protein [Pseudomonadota bacterium]
MKNLLKPETAQRIAQMSPESQARIVKVASNLLAIKVQQKFLASPDKPKQK